MEWPFNKINYILFGIGLFSIIVGYLLIGYNLVDSALGIKVAPIMLFVGYCVIIPIAIIYKPKN